MALVLRFPFLDFSPKVSPLSGLLIHYALVEKGVALIPEAVASYSAAKYKRFSELQETVDKIEEKADAAKRSIRNHMPKSLFMPVDRTLFFTLTRSQDNILDRGQDALNWLAMNHIKIPKIIKADLKSYLQDVMASVTILRTPLEQVVEMVGGGTLDREEIKEHCRAVLRNHEKVSAEKRRIIAKLYSSDEPFKDTYQLLKFIEEMADVSHNTERCSDMLRAMIAK